jgi:hypothetical protein
MELYGNKSKKTKNKIRSMKPLSLVSAIKLINLN